MRVFLITVTDNGNLCNPWNIPISSNNCNPWDITDKAIITVIATITTFFTDFIGCSSLMVMAPDNNGKNWIGISMFLVLEVAPNLIRFLLA